MRKKTHKEFLEDLYIKNKTYREGLLKIIGKYNGKDSKLLVENMYGILSVIPNNLLLLLTSCKNFSPLNPLVA